MNTFISIYTILQLILLCLAFNLNKHCFRLNCGSFYGNGIRRCCRNTTIVNLFQNAFFVRLLNFFIKPEEPFLPLITLIAGCLIWLQFLTLLKTLGVNKSNKHPKARCETLTWIHSCLIWKLGVMSLVWVWIIWMIGLIDGGPHFRIRIILGTILIWFVEFHVCVPECSRNGSGVRPYLWLQEKFV